MTLSRRTRKEEAEVCQSCLGPSSRPSTRLATGSIVHAPEKMETPFCGFIHGIPCCTPDCLLGRPRLKCIYAVLAPRRKLPVGSYFCCSSVVRPLPRLVGWLCCLAGPCPRRKSRGQTGLEPGWPWSARKSLVQELQTSGSAPRCAIRRVTCLCRPLSEILPILIWRCRSALDRPSRRRSSWPA